MARAARRYDLYLLKKALLRKFDQEESLITEQSLRVH
jgi:hypothetical protein